MDSHWHLSNILRIHIHAYASNSNNRTNAGPQDGARTTYAGRERQERPNQENDFAQMTHTYTYTEGEKEGALTLLGPPAVPA